MECPTSSPWNTQYNLWLCVRPLPRLCPLLVLPRYLVVLVILIARRLQLIVANWWCCGLNVGNHVVVVDSKPKACCLHAKYHLAFAVFSYWVMQLLWPCVFFIELIQLLEGGVGAVSCIMTYMCPIWRLLMACGLLYDPWSMAAETSATRICYSTCEDSFSHVIYRGYLCDGFSF